MVVPNPDPDPSFDAGPATSPSLWRVLYRLESTPVVLMGVVKLINDLVPTPTRTRTPNPSPNPNPNPTPTLKSSMIWP